MKQLYNYLEKIADKSSSKQKFELLYEMLRVVPNAEEFLRLSFNDVIYGVSVRSFEKICNYDGKEVYFDPGELIEKHANDNILYPFEEIELKKLKELSGNIQLNFMKGLFLNMNKQQAKWTTRLILKDLKIGVQLKTINKALEMMGKPLIEKFQVQLCGKFDSCDDYNLEYPVLGCVKYDGFRCWLIKEDNKIKLISRQGELVDYVPEINKAFKNIPNDTILDGEILADDFSLIQARIGRKLENIKPVKGLHFRAFDILKWWNVDLKDKKQFERTKNLQEIDFSIIDSNFLKLEESKIINNIVELKEYFNTMVERGEEGIIIKLLDKPYEYDSRTNWFKVKPKFEASFEVTGWKKGTGKKAGLIGSIAVKDKSGRVTSSCGAGLKDQDILNLMNLERVGELIGSIVDIEYNEITKNKFGDYSLRFPSFLKLRTDKAEADTITL